MFMIEIAGVKVSLLICLMNVTPIKEMCAFKIMYAFKI